MSAPSNAGDWLASVILREDWLDSITKVSRLAATRGWIVMVSHPTRRVGSWRKSLKGLCQRVFQREYARIVSIWPIQGCERTVASADPHRSHMI
jgi:hypothetical protein